MYLVAHKKTSRYDFQLNNRLGPWSSHGAFSAWRPRSDSRMPPVGSNLESVKPMILFNEQRTVRLQCVLCDAHRVNGGAVWMEDEVLTACVAANGGHFEHLQ